MAVLFMTDDNIDTDLSIMHNARTLRPQLVSERSYETEPSHLMIEVKFDGLGYGIGVVQHAATAIHHS